MRTLLQKPHTKKNYSSPKKIFGVIFLSLFVFIVTFSILFFVTQESKPYFSELAFTEYSQHGEGSVIPASCVSGVYNGDGNFSGCTLCWNGNWTEISGCPAQPVNGSCSPYHYACLTGTSANNINGTNDWTWSCTGSNGGTTASCTEAKPLAGTLSATPSTCTVPNGTSTCTSSFTWTTASAIGPTQVIGDGGGPTSTPVSAGTESLKVRYINGSSAHVFQLYDNAASLAAASVVADCSSSSAWNASSCQACANGGCTNHVCNNGAINAPTCTPAPTITSFTATPSTLVANDTSTLAWSGVSGATSCNLNGGEFTSLPVGSAVSGNQITGPILVTTPYTLTCTNNGGLTTQSTSTVSVVDPQVASFTLAGNNTPTGTFSLTCTGSTRYDILKNGVSVYGGSQLYPGSTVTRNVTTGDSGNYIGVCVNGPVERYSPGIFYDSYPLRPIISITASPRTIQKNSKTILTWSITNPVATGVSCSIDAKAVCTAGGCSSEQTTTEATVKSILASGLIDAGGVTIANSVMGTPLVSGKSVGSKTFRLANSVDFTITCTHPSGAVKSSTRVMVTETNER